MKLTVLIDNHTYIDQYYYGEPGVCYYIEDAGTKILFDTGYSNIFIQNAKSLNKPLDEISTVVISHGHNDHTGGLKYFLDEYAKENMQVVAHPKAFLERAIDGVEIGSPISESEIKNKCRLVLTKEPLKISENIFYLGEIPKSNTFETRAAIGKHQTEDDFVMDDSAIAYHGKDGIYIITGCSHSGICNIIEYAKEALHDNKVIGVIGGFHLTKVNDRLEKTIQYFQDNDIKLLYPCHCVSFKARAEIHKARPIHEVGVGMEIIWE